MSTRHTHRKKSFGAHLQRALPIIVIVSVLVHLLHHGIWFSPFETATLDALLLQREPKEARQVALVTIDDDDYKKIFKSKSPLDPKSLETLLAAIAAGHPRLIGVDIDTSSTQFSTLLLPRGAPTVVWAQDALFNVRQECECFEPLPVLGGRRPAPPAGIAVIPQDADGFVRRYRLQFHTPNGWVPSFAWSLVAIDKPSSPEDHDMENGEELIPDFYRFPRLNARDVSALANTPDWISRGGPISHKIVLLGGTYRAARDEYRTPLGAKAGVELAALAVESQLEHQGILPVNQFLLVILEIIASILLVWIHWRLPLLRALLVSLLVIPLAALVASALVFSTLAYWMNSVPLLAAVWLHQIYDHILDYRKMYLKLEHHKSTS